MISQDPLKTSLLVNRPGLTLRGQVVDNLRKAIVEGQLGPGRRLIERELCELLGVSRTLVREALRQLEAEGWVQNQLHRGPSVASISRQEALELYEVRLALEGMAAELFVIRAADSDLTELAAAVDQMAEAQARGDLDSQVRQVDRFYEIMLRAAGNEMLGDLLEAQRSRLRYIRAISLARPQRAVTSVQEKREWLQAFRSRDAKAARALCETHIRNAAAATDAAFEAEVLPQAEQAPQASSVG